MFGVGQRLRQLIISRRGQMFEQQVRQRLQGRDDADWPILPTALGLGCVPGHHISTTGVCASTANLDVPLAGDLAYSLPLRLPE